MIDQGHIVGKWHSSNQVTVPLEGQQQNQGKREEGEESERGRQTDFPLGDSKKKKGTPALGRYDQMEH